MLFRSCNAFELLCLCILFLFESLQRGSQGRRRLLLRNELLENLIVTWNQFSYSELCGLKVSELCVFVLLLQLQRG